MRIVVLNDGETFRIDDSCVICERMLQKIKALQNERNPTLYGNTEIKVILTPDYNASGVLTHWHIELNPPKRFEDVNF